MTGPLEPRELPPDPDAVAAAPPHPAGHHPGAEAPSVPDEAGAPAPDPVDAEPRAQGGPAVPDDADPGPGDPLAGPPARPAPRRGRRREPVAQPVAATAGERPVRSPAVRAARLHLRSGALALARAELEALAGRGRLDEEALLDLAEVRWRSGDLAGAGEAASVLLDRSRSDLLALVVAAEAAAALGRPAEARRHAERALADGADRLDGLFAGMPRSALWPSEREHAVVAEARPVLRVVGGPEGAGSRPGRAVRPPTSATAAEAFAGGRAALAAGDVAGGALRLGLALRLDPGFAPAILAGLGDWTGDPHLALVAGDALRAAGREDEALAAFELARALG